MALYRAIQWEQTLADSCGILTEDGQEAMELAKDFERLLTKRGGAHMLVDPFKDAKLVSIHDLKKGGRDGTNDAGEGNPERHS